MTDHSNRHFASISSVTKKQLKKNVKSLYLYYHPYTVNVHWSFTWYLTTQCVWENLYHNSKFKFYTRHLRERIMQSWATDRQREPCREPIWLREIPAYASVVQYFLWWSVVHRACHYTAYTHIVPIVKRIKNKRFIHALLSRWMIVNIICCVCVEDQKQMIY